MIKKVAGTIATRLAGMVLGLCVTILAGHELGVEGLGTIGLVVLGISVVSLLASTLGSGVLTYLVPRVPLRRLLPPAYLWATGACVVGGLLLYRFELVPAGYAGHVTTLAFLQAVYSIHFGVLLGQERIKTYNTIVVVQALVALVVFAALILTPGATAMAFVYASYAAHTSSVVLSAYALRNGTRPTTAFHGAPLRTFFRQGTIVQLSNALQLMNYRLVYWLIERSFGTATLGAYTVANQLAEGAWLAPKSLGTVLFSRMSNIVDPVEQRTVTVLVLKAAMACSTGLLLILLALPDQFFTWVFGPEVKGLRWLLMLLAPGILAVSASQAFGHYFSGTAQNLHNTASSALGLLITVVFGTWAVPEHGTTGAAITATLAYVVGAMYLLIVFLRITGMPLSALFPNAQDGQRVKALFTEARKGLSRRSR